MENGSRAIGISNYRTVIGGRHSLSIYAARIRGLLNMGPFYPQLALWANDMPPASPAANCITTENRGYAESTKNVPLPPVESWARRKSLLRATRVADS
jgi:hypothetical protein